MNSIHAAEPDWLNSNEWTVKWSVLSDRDKGLTAADEALPHTIRGICAYHAKLNVKKRFKNPELTSVFEGLARCIDDASVNRKMRQIQELGGPEAVAYINTIPAEKFIARNFPGSRFGHVSSSIAESNNSWLVGVREDSTLLLLDGIWHMEAERRAARLKAGVERAPTLAGYTVWGEQMIKGNLAYARGCDVQITYHLPNIIDPRRSTIEARVTSPQQENSHDPSARRMHVVRVHDAYCSCLRWQDYQLPYGHACATIMKAGLAPKDFMGDRYGMIYYRMCYGIPMRPCNIEDLVEAPNVKPPAHRNKPGKQAKKRKEAGDKWNPLGPTMQPHCSICNRVGHNATTCADKNRDVFSLD